MPVTIEWRLLSASLEGGCDVSGVPPHFDQQRRGTHAEERVERRVNALVQTEKHLDGRNAEGNHALTHSRLHGSFGIGDHEKNEELIFRACNG